MSRRYRYEPRMTARELSKAMNALGLTARKLARISGARADRVEKWLRGEEDIPVYVQRDLWIWQQDEESYGLAIEWADQHARNVHNDEP